jgi:hypothetical protein
MAISGLLADGGNQDYLNRPSEHIARQKIHAKLSKLAP